MEIRPIDANALKTKAHITRTRALDNLTIEIANVSVDEIDNAPALSLNTLRDAIYQDAVEHGLWEEVEKDAVELSEEEPPSERERWYSFHRRVYAIKEVYSECDEALTAAEEEDWDNLQEELADVVIQAFSTAGYLGIDIDTAIRRKMEINKGRPWKHGKEERP